ncbi:hypothetical protein FQR65_LT09826 [Abscondita terminalis]|nr:hypothetical protein FQR65_LT09826 [Abscondita terminalis]
MATVLDNLKNIICQVEDCAGPCGPCAPLCSPPDFPFLQVCMMVPPCRPAPTAPEYVKPLRLPNVCPPLPPPRNYQEELLTKKANFYNFHNCDYRKTGLEMCGPPAPRQAPKRKYCEDVRWKKQVESGCPTGFKPCDMRLCPPPLNHPLGTWTATIMPCPPKPRLKPSCKYDPFPCTKPGCLHKITRCCNYNCPCKAHCYNHPPGIKPCLMC